MNHDAWSTVMVAPEETHHLRNGQECYAARFLEVLKFHPPGLAAVRDATGGYHVDIRARPLYAKRFAAVEPFYNGQARVEGFDGALEVIDETGATIHRLRGPRQTALSALSADMVGFWKTQAIHAAVDVGVFDALPAGASEAARKTAIPEEHMLRLLQALWELDLVHPVPSGEWLPTERGQLLGASGPAGMAAAARVWAGDHYTRWMQLPAALKAPPSLFCRASYFEGLSGVMLPDYHSAMSAYAKHDYAALSSALDWSVHHRIIDAGGSWGTLLFMLLDAHPHLQGILLDRAEVTARASVPANLCGRVEICNADLFEPWPVRADAILLARVLHDWPDGDAQCILKRAREALDSGGRIYVLEMLLQRIHPPAACST